MRKKLTDTNIKGKPPSDGTGMLWDTVVPGLALRFGKRRRTYSVTTRINGKQVKRRIGTSVTKTLAEARDAARDILRDAEKGIDSASSTAIKTEAEKAAANTFQTVAGEWLADGNKGGGAKLRTRKAVERRLVRLVYPTIGDTPLEDIERVKLRRLVKRIARKHPVAANRTLADLRRVFNYAVREDRLVASPAIGIDPPGDEQDRDRVLNGDELAGLWAASDRLGYPFGPLFKMLILTGARRSEVAEMEWSEIDGGNWILPSDRSKNGRVHLWPLSRAAMDVLDGVPRIDGLDTVFTSGRARTRDESGQRMVDRPVSGWGRVKERVDRVVAEIAAEKAGEPVDVDKHGLAPWRVHDIRRSVVTGMNEKLGIEPHVVEATIGHLSGSAKSGIAGVYNRSSYLQQRTAALESWGNYVLSLVGEKQVDNVVDLRDAAR